LVNCQISASRNGPPRDAPPPYVSPTGGFYPAAPPAYTPPPNGYYGWVPPTNVFPDRPAADAVYMTDMPPPYPGINGYNGYATASAPTPEAMGFAAPQQPSAAEAKAMEAAQSAYYDPNRPQMAYVPPPAYYVS
jgi:WW domain-binding protein 2